MKIVYKVVRDFDGCFTSIFHLPLGSVYYKLGEVTRVIKVKDAVYGRLFVFDTLENAKNLIANGKFSLPSRASFTILKCETTRCFKMLLSKQRIIRYAKINNYTLDNTQHLIESFSNNIYKGTLYCDSVKPIEIVL